MPKTLASLVMSICIVGAGPAGLTVASRLLRNSSPLKINILEARSSPFGLLKYGVAPDHPEIRNVSTQYAETLQDNRVKFYGNVKVGTDVSVDELLAFHDSVVFSTGMTSPRLLGIPGEHLPGSYTASQIVGWYNGDPGFKDVTVNLGGVKRVAIIGHGNVALDICRLMLKSSDMLAETDISKEALSALSLSTIKQIDIFGRRGPLQLREMFKLQNTEFGTDVNLVKKILDENKTIWEENRPMKRLFSLLKQECENAHNESDGSLAFRRWNLRYFLRPREILGRSKVETVEFVKTKPVDTTAKDFGGLRSQRVTDISEEVVRLPYDMIVSCIGFTSTQTFGLPIGSHGEIENENGRVKSRPGLYVCGWAAVGPVGELASTSRHAKLLADNIMSDLQSQKMEPRHSDDLSAHLAKKNIYHTPNNKLI